MNQGKFPTKLVTGILIALFFGVALYIRIALPYDRVFSGDWIKFTGVDAYYHMRLLDNLLHHFPERISFDPYTFYPHGTTVGWTPFFGWLLGGIIWLVGLGSPSQHTIDVISAYFPAILGALTVIPVYFIGKALFNRWTGVIAAGLIAILPGEFLGRSILGFTDHHVAEVLFSTVTTLFLILTVKVARQKQLSFSHLKERDWSVITAPLIYALIAGVFLGIYLLTWVGGLLFVFLFFLYFVVQSIIDHLKGESTEYLAIVGTLVFLISAVISMPFVTGTTWFGSFYLPSFIIAMLTVVVLAVISEVMMKRKLRLVYYPLSLIGLGLAGLAVFYAVEPSLLKAMVGQFAVFGRTGAALTIIEVQPLLLSDGRFSFSTAWGYFTTGFFLSFISLGILIYLLVKRNETDKTLFIVWCLMILAATLGQRRFAYYFAVNVALLTGYISWQMLQLAGFKEIASQPETKLKKLKKKDGLKRPEKKGLRITASRVIMIFGVIVVLLLVFSPNVFDWKHLNFNNSPTISIAKAARFAPNDAWQEALSWLKDNTPDPFGNPDFYYATYEPPPQGEPYKYPTSAYGVMVWWDYGHWVTRMAHRIPISNPFQQGASTAGQFFTAQDEASANKMMDELGAKYVVIDNDSAVMKFHAIATFAGSSPEKFRDAYYQNQEGKLVPVVVFYPEYYRSLAVRLYNFDGKAVTPENTIVISYEARISRDGIHYKEITSSKQFPTYDEAVAYISNQKTGNYRIVGANPFISPVPLDELKHYKLIYHSDAATEQPGVGAVPTLKIFEYESEAKDS